MNILYNLGTDKVQLIKSTLNINLLCLQLTKLQ
jgi:hypothetical protein